MCAIHEQCLYERPCIPCCLKVMPDSGTITLSTITLLYLRLIYCCRANVFLRFHLLLQVELEHGVEMLKIFKNYESHSSILDDFHFYEERQRVMQARKSRQQASQVTAAVTGDSEQYPVSISNDYVEKLSKSFAQAVSVNENEAKLSLTQLPHENRS